MTKYQTVQFAKLITHSCRKQLIKNRQVSVYRTGPMTSYMCYKYIYWVRPFYDVLATPTASPRPLHGTGHPRRCGRGYCISRVLSCNGASQTVWIIDSFPSIRIVFNAHSYYRVLLLLYVCVVKHLIPLAGVCIIHAPAASARVARWWGVSLKPDCKTASRPQADSDDN